MPILGLQRQMRELGRIRIGNQVAASGRTGSRPNKLETFRLTSSSRELVDAAAAAYGGKVQPWQNGDSAEFEVITAAAALDIMVPPYQPVTQWMELWSGGGCQRRCDGTTNVLDMSPCACPADVEQRLALAAKGQACKATTRLSVILPALPDLGVWRLESHGYYAAVELAGAAEILAMATARGALIPARLRLEQREKRTPGQPTKKYAVPIIEFVETRMADLQLTAGPAGGAPRQLDRPARPELPATTLPPASDFRAPTPTDAPGRDADPAQLPGSTGEVDAAAGADGDVVEGQIVEPAGLTRDQLVDGLRDLGISTADAATRSKAMFPDRGETPLTDAQRGQLLEALRSARKPGGGRPRKVPGVCAVCRVDVRNALRHYTSRSHQDRVAAWQRARARERERE